VRATIAKQTLTLNPLAPASIDAGQEVTATGTASSGLIGKEVWLQAFTNEAWTNVVSAIVAPDGTFVIRAVFATAGQIRLRAASAGDPAGLIGDATTTEQVLPVYTWYPLINLEATLHNDPNTAVVAEGRIQGVAYPSSIQMNAPQLNVTEWARYRTRSACTNLRATFGVSDTATDPTTAFAVQVFAGTTSVWLPAGNVTQASPLRAEIELPPVEQIRLEGRKLIGTAGPDSPLIIGSPEVRCAF
jgi:hypothetical protein